MIRRLRIILKAVLERLDGFLLSLIKSLSDDSERSINLINKSYDKRLNCYKIIIHNKSHKILEDLLKDLFYFMRTDTSLKKIRIY